MHCARTRQCEILETHWFKGNVDGELCVQGHLAVDFHCDMSLLAWSVTHMLKTASKQVRLATIRLKYAIIAYLTFNASWDGQNAMTTKRTSANKYKMWLHGHHTINWPADKLFRFPHMPVDRQIYSNTIEDMFTVTQTHALGWFNRSLNVAHVASMVQLFLPMQS